MSNLKLTIDLGSTEFKAAIFTDNMQLLGSAGHRLSYCRNGAKVELPVDIASKAFAEAIIKTIKSSGASIDDIGSVGITSQAQTFALSDQDDKFITPFISWLDMRAVETCKTIALENFAEHCSIAEIQPNMQICIFKHFLDENPEIVRKKIKVMPLPTYLIKLLTGRYVSDNNLTAMSGLFSLKENNYWQPALDLLNIDKNNLPDVVEIGDFVEKTKNNNPFGIPDEVPVFSCGNDQTAGAYGACLQANDMLITLGTAQTAYRCSEKMPMANSVQFRGYYPDGLYYSMFAGIGGDLITKSIEKVPEFKDFKTFSELAANANTSINAGFYTQNNEIGWYNDNAGLAEKALSVLNFLADEIFYFSTKLTINLEKDPIIYVAGGGQKIPTWIRAIEKILQHEIKSISASPTYGVALMIDKKISKTSTNLT